MASLYFTHNLPLHLFSSQEKSILSPHYINKYRSDHWRALQCRITGLGFSQSSNKSSYKWKCATFKYIQSLICENICFSTSFHVSSFILEFQSERAASQAGVCSDRQKNLSHVCNHGSHREEKQKSCFLIVWRKKKEDPSNDSLAPVREHSWANLPQTSLIRPCCRDIRSASISLH